MQTNHDPIISNDTDLLGQRGFSLLELLVAMTLFMVVTGSIWGVLRIAQQSRAAVNQNVPLSKNVRIALNVIGHDTYNAGFGYPLGSTVVLPDNRISTLLGIPNDFDTSRHGPTYHCRQQCKSGQLQHDGEYQDGSDHISF